MTRSTRRSRHRRGTSLIAYGAAAVALATAATYGTIALASPPDDAADGKGESAHALQDAFASAAEEFKVPQSILLAVSYRQTLWDSHGGQPSTTGNYNVMALTQVNAADIAVHSASDASSELNLSGDPRKTRHFHPDKSVLARVGKVNTADPRLHTLDEAAELIGKPAAELRTDPAQSIRGAAALLARYEKEAYGSLPPDTGRWYPAVARYSQSPDTKGADLFAGRVFDSIRTGESRITDDGQQVTLPAEPSVRAVKTARTPLAALAGTTTTQAPQCPTSLNCNFAPAAFKQNGTDKGDYGNYDVTDRPADGVKINSIVIHDTEGSYSGSLATFQNPTAYASAHYLIRASDGLVTQMVPLKDTAWHAGNKSVNMHSVGIEHEGYAIKAGSWYTEPQYESSAQIIRYVSALYGIPRDREHIFGHDEVPGPLDAYVGGMHWDPGPYWDWNHLMALVGAPTGAGNAGAPLRTGQVIRVVPPYTTANQPTITYGGATQAARPANFGYLYTQASASSARLGDPYLHSGTAGTTDGPDWGDKVVAGGTYVVAQQSGNWTAIWYGGQKGWFYNPGGQFSSTVGSGSVTVLTPAAGRSTIPVYGRAYPESAAYAGTDVPVQTDSDKALTKYAIAAGQKYVPAGPVVNGNYFYAENYDNSAPGDHTLVTGNTQFYPIRFNHRLAWVKAADVAQVASTATLPGSTRNNVVGRDTSGVIWQHQGTGNASTPFLSRFKIGTWLKYNAITALTPLRADGVGDVVARDTSGVLWYYQGSGSATHPFKVRVKVGTGFGGYTILVGARDMNGDGRADLIARDTHGNLWLYKGTGTSGVLATRVVIGTGYIRYTAMAGVGDVSGDGKADLMARDDHGNLWLFKGTRTSAVFAPRVAVGSGFNAYNALVGVGDITGDGRADMVARDTRGNLWQYKGTGSATAPWSARVSVGGGWSGYSQLF
ncbi:N-acetylmuramoyl-L-alanine amidase [Streptomyces sp.]|uniref:N-acetylmuramoyl-L-alanine amidase n=1 Tax=Streptomyces sp. TaxID=1931 RepID=UPI002F4278A3